MISDAGLDDTIYHFLYRSNASAELGQDQIDAIVDEARQRNAEMALTGCLHYEDGLFFQWLEGPKSKLDEVIAMIRRDPRHEDMTDLAYGPSRGRQFGDWTMRSTNRDEASLLEWFANHEVSTIDRGAYAGSIGAFLMAMN
ncbi:BLUF domain-containing protein [Paracoccus sp. TK19116]|uniref:BLUF domain-containing protein n=1 Tax=Paracoccus albicereus TaxID=2922394 RepID=A0ABT1MNT6_9RHOB|nr:BLUF domain-containing protein [Paracoccus albicereus]MCQ0969950.1 BLUF domain-containing protein [Paracoccus albicereus]